MRMKTMRMKMKHRSRVLPILLVLMMIPLLSACSKAPAEGVYKLVRIKEGNKTVKISDLADYGLESSYAVFDEEGEGLFVLMETPFYVSYDSEDKSFYTDYGYADYRSEFRGFTVKDKHVALTFKKREVEPPEEPDYPDVLNNYYPPEEDETEDMDYDEDEDDESIPIDERSIENLLDEAAFNHYYAERYGE